MRLLFCHMAHKPTRLALAAMLGMSLLGQERQLKLMSLME